MAKTIILKSIFIAYVALISLVSTSKCDSIFTNSTGLTIDLIHRDHSPQSPYYDPSLSPTQRTINAIRRSINRNHHLNDSHFTQSPESDIIQSGGDYLIKYSIGTPPVPSIGIIDTASTIIWTQCRPCLKCFNQNLTFFRASMSSTYKVIPCNTPYCKLSPKTSCSPRKNNCLYYLSYGDGSFTQGALGTDVITLSSSGGSRASIPNFIFGCGYRNEFSYPGGESGIVALGGGKISLARQLGPLAKGRFSYCFVSRFGGNSNKLSKLNFGDNAVVKGRDVAVTPLARKKPDTFYFVTLLEISVGNKRFYSSFQQGNMIIDSGTTLTKLPNDLYYQVKKELQSQVKLKQIKDPEGVFDLCFFTRRDVQTPEIVFHFEFAEVYLKQENMFLRTSEDSVCFAAKPAGKRRAILGNLAQVNFLVGFDLEREVVYFKPTDCSAL
ncbi:hypothetical protein DH2020_046979 [Rehmannia glutinosa]|uniref:Peptidase A1 domain-containing protein n=1 Tax=Rehmannia glutinosa TaxID=99300 RepID=A0ABR0UAT9_REHGL